MRSPDGSIRQRDEGRREHHQQHCHATPTRQTDGVEHGRIQPIIARDRAVVIQRQN
jgi:hypothetical protein